MNNQMDFLQFKGLIRRRKGILIITFALGLIVSGALAIFLPSTYRSEVTFKVEAQEIPEEYVSSAASGLIEKRLEKINQQVLLDSKLENIINKLGLYPEMWGKYPMAGILKKMRKDISFKNITTPDQDKRTGRMYNALVGFTLYYEGKDPETAKKVTDILASLYIQEEEKIKDEKTANITLFLQDELGQLKNQINDFEVKISRFKEAHIGELPGQESININAIERLENRLDSMNTQIRSLEERKVYLNGQLATVDPLNPIITKDGKVAMNPREQLKELRLQLIRLQSSLSEKHPNVIALKNQIRELESQVGNEDDSSAEKIKSLNDMQGRLTTLKGKLGPKHPDVIRLSKEVEILSGEVNKLVAAKAVSDASKEKPDNPTYINLMTQISAVTIELNALREEQKTIKDKIDQYQQRVENAPLVEQEYKMLTLDYQSAKNKYDDISKKLQETRVARGMEETSRGERISIRGSASLPERPYKPNRLAIISIGAFVGISLGFGLASFKEFTDHSVKTVNEVNNIMGVPVFSVIPLLMTDLERKTRRRKWYLFALILLVVAGILVFELIRRNQIPGNVI